MKVETIRCDICTKEMSSVTAPVPIKYKGRNVAVSWDTMGLSTATSTALDICPYCAVHITKYLYQLAQEGVKRDNTESDIALMLPEENIIDI